MTRPVRIAAAIVLGVALGLILHSLRRRPPLPEGDPVADSFVRQALFAEIQPVKLSNCHLERLGEPNDGGYLVCANLLTGVHAAYSYGISGYDGWGCDVSRRLNVKTHQYDCFDLRAPSCPAGQTVFHGECIGPAKLEAGRSFDTLENQIGKNGDIGKHIVMKIDVEGAEWDTFLTADPALLERIDQLIVEFHDTEQMRFVAAVRRLRQFFYVAHLHFNNFSCVSNRSPFPAFAYEVLLVNKKLGVIDPTGAAVVPRPLDAKNQREAPDCQTAASQSTRQ